MGVLGLSYTGVSGDVRALAKMTRLRDLRLYKTKVTAPQGCPRDSGGDLWYEDAASCRGLLDWLDRNPPRTDQ